MNDAIEGASPAAVKLKQQVLSYMASFGRAPGRLFTLREFNSQIMLHTYSAEERVLEAVLADLVKEGVLVQHSKTEFMLVAGATRT